MVTPSVSTALSQPPNLPDVLTTFAAAAAKTSSVNLGTIVPTYPRHPLVLVVSLVPITGTGEDE